MTTSLQRGTRLANRYEVQCELGRGGMGVVYACQDLLTGERVALKLLHSSEGSPAPGTMAWFWAEARALASLDHPGIVRGRDFGVLVGGSPYLAMDLAPGISLPDLLSVTELSWGCIWLVIDQVLGALAHAHARGVIHGDLKHSNVMVEVRPGALHVRILDFGLAWLLRDRFDHRIDGTAREGPMMHPRAGTVGWMAPEQIRGAVPHVGPPTDLYALGCILYQLLTGSEPYESEDVNQIQLMHRNSPVPEVELPDGVPIGVAPFVRRLLAKRPWQRFDLAADARRIFASFRPEGPPSSWALPDPAVCDEAITLRPPPPPASRALSRPVNISAADTLPSGVLGFGPNRVVGRQAQKDQLRVACDELISAPPSTTRLLVLTGPAGVGKSSLAEWVCEDAHERGIAIPLRARHNRIPTPFDGIVGAVLAHLGLENAERAVIERVLLNIWEVSRADEDGRLWVAAVAEWLRPSNPGSQEEPGPTGKRFVISSNEVRWVVMRYALQRLGRDRPLLLWLDDLHLAAQRDFGWIEKLCAERHGLRILLLATIATGAPDTNPQQISRVMDLVQRFEGSSLEVPPLNETEVRELLRFSALLDEEVVLGAYRRSRGIPLFALQLIHAWANGGQLELRDGRYCLKREGLNTVPPTTAALWDERLAALPDKARITALAASALGGEVRRDVLVPLLNSLNLSPTESLSMLEHLQLLVKLDVNRYRWTHTLLQEHLLTKLSERPDAAHIFKQAAFALASYHPASGNRRIVRHRVMNLVRAKEESEAVKVMLDYVARAWERNRDVTGTLEDLAMIDGLARGAWAAAHNRWRSEALRHAGQLDEALSLARLARRAFAAVNDIYNEAQCLRLIGHIASDKGAPRNGRDLVAQARIMMDSIHCERGRAQCDVVLGELDYLLGQYDLAQRELEQALGSLDQAEDILGRGQCLILLALILLSKSDCTRARNHLLDARQGFDRIGNRLGMAQCDVALAHADHRAGELEAARARGQNALSSFRMLGTPRGQSAALRLMAMAALDAGDLTDAETRTAEAKTLYEQMGDPWGIVECNLLLAQVSLARGAGDARQRVEACDIKGLQEREPLQHWHLTHAWLACREGRYEAALEHIQAAHKALGGGRMGDHAPHLFARLSAMPWPESLRTKVIEYLPASH